MSTRSALWWPSHAEKATCYLLFGEMSAFYYKEDSKMFLSKMYENYQQKHKKHFFAAGSAERH